MCQLAAKNYADQLVYPRYATAEVLCNGRQLAGASPVPSRIQPCLVVYFVLSLVILAIFRSRFFRNWRAFYGMGSSW